MGVAVPRRRAVGYDHRLGFRCPLPPSSVAVHCKSPTAHCPQVAWQCVEAFPQHNTKRQRGGALHNFYCLLPLDSVAVHCESSTTHCPETLRQCITAVPLPATRRQCGGA